MIPASARASSCSGVTRLSRDAATSVFSPSAGQRRVSWATMFRRVLPVEISSSTNKTVSVSCSRASRSPPQSFCSAAWLCSSKKRTQPGPSPASRVVLRKAQSGPSRLATAAPRAVAVSAKPRTSLAPGKFLLQPLPQGPHHGQGLRRGDGHVLGLQGVDQQIGPLGVPIAFGDPKGRFFRVTCRVAWHKTSCPQNMT